MSKKQKNYGAIPHVPFTPWVKPGNQDDARDEGEDNTRKENIKSTVKSVLEQKADRKKSTVDNRREQWKQFFDYRMEMQDMFTASLPDDISSLPPFAQNLPMSPKAFMEWLKEFQIMANEHFMEQAESFNDFCIQAQQQFYDLVSSAMDNTDGKDS